MNKILITALVAVLALIAPISVMAADLSSNADVMFENMTPAQREDLAVALALAIGKSFGPLNTSADTASEVTMTPAEMQDFLNAMATFGKNFMKPLTVGAPAAVENPRAEFLKALPIFLNEIHTIVLVDGHVTQYPLNASETSLVMVIGNSTHDLSNWFAPFSTTQYTLPAVNGFAPLTIELPDEAAILIRLVPMDGTDCLQQVFKRYDFPHTDGSGLDTVSVQRCL